jgi:GT2 family glycosyltransferase
METHTAITLSVVIPVYNGAKFLPECLKAIRQSDYQPLEVVVVNDSSTDSSVRVAEEAGATVLHTRANPGSPGAPSGPAAARLMGVQHAQGAVVVFIDADVWLHKDALGRFVRCFEDPGIDAVFGSYDNMPPERNFVSQWKNLSHHYFHQTASPEAQTFWSGCGAIRREVFLAVGGFDLRYRGATIEDIDLGYRLRAAGHRILLDRDIQASHAKRWTAWSAWKTDLLYRGIPWMQLILRSGNLPNDLNTSLSQRASVLGGGLALPVLLAALASLPFDAALALLLCLLLALSHFWLEPWTATSAAAGWLRGIAIVGAAVVLAPIADAPLMAIPFCLLPVHAFAFRRSHPPRMIAAASLSFGLLLLLGTAAIAQALPANPSVILLGILVILLLALNSRYFEFLARKRGLEFAITALPMQTLHFLAGALSAAIGIALHARHHWQKREQP